MSLFTDQPLIYGMGLVIAGIVAIYKGYQFFTDPNSAEDTPPMQKLIAPVGMIVGLVLVLAGGFFVAQNLNLDSSSKDSKTFVSALGNSELTVPGSWELMTDLNDDAEIQVGHSNKVCYAIVISDNAEDLESFEAYQEIVVKNFTENMKDLVIESPVADTINGLIASRVKIYATMNGLNIIYLMTLVKSETQFFQILTWTVKSRYEKNESELLAVTRSFKAHQVEQPAEETP